MIADAIGALRSALSSTLPPGGFRRSVAVLASGTALGQGLLVLVSPILTRLYSPDDIGVWAVYGSMLSIVAVVATLRYELAIPLPKDDAAAANLLAVALVALAGMGLLVAIVVRLAGSRLCLLLSAPALEPQLWLLPGSLLALGVFQALNYWALRRRSFAAVAGTKLGQSLGQALAQVVLGLLRSGPLGLLVADVVGRACSASSLAALVWRQDRVSLRQTSLQDMRAVAVRYRRFPLLSSTAALLNVVGAQLPLLLMASLYGMVVMGWLSLAQRVLVVPLNLIASSAAQVYVGEAAKARRTQSDQLPRLFTRMFWGMLLVTLVYVALLALSAPTLFPLVFGASWNESAAYVRILAAMVVLQNVASPLSGTLDVLERQDLNLANEVVRFVLMMAAVVAAGHLAQAPRLGVALFSAAGALGYLSLLLTCAHAVRVRSNLMRPISSESDGA